MTARRCLLQALVTCLSVILLLPTCIDAFSANPVENLLENVFKNRSPSTATDDVETSPGDALLKQLDIQSNTEPRPFTAEVSQLPALVTASMPVCTQ